MPAMMPTMMLVLLNLSFSSLGYCIMGWDGILGLCVDIIQQIWCELPWSQHNPLGLMHGFCEMGACQKWASWDLRLLTVLVGGSLHAKLVQVTRLKTPILLLLFMAPVACGLPPNVAHALDSAIAGQVAYANPWAHPHPNLFCLCVL